MRGRFTLEEVNAAISDIATYAEANSHLVSAPKKEVFIHSFVVFNLCVYNLVVLANNFPFM